MHESVRRRALPPGFAVRPEPGLGQRGRAPFCCLHVRPRSSDAALLQSETRARTRTDFDGVGFCSMNYFCVFQSEVERRKAEGNRELREPESEVSTVMTA